MVFRWHVPLLCFFFFNHCFVQLNLSSIFRFCCFLLFDLLIHGHLKQFLYLTLDDTLSLFFFRPPLYTQRLHLYVDLVNLIFIAFNKKKERKQEKSIEFAAIYSGKFMCNTLPPPLAFNNVLNGDATIMFAWNFSSLQFHKPQLVYIDVACCTCSLYIRIRYRHFSTYYKHRCAHFYDIYTRKFCIYLRTVNTCSKYIFIAVKQLSLRT